MAAVERTNYFNSYDPYWRKFLLQKIKCILSRSVCLFICTISVLVSLPVAVIWVQGWILKTHVFPNYWYLYGRHLNGKSKVQGKGRQMWWVQMGERSSFFSLLGAIHVLAPIPFKCLPKKNYNHCEKQGPLCLSWIIGTHGSIHLLPSPFLSAYPLKTHWTSMALWTSSCYDLLVTTESQNSQY